MQIPLIPTTKTYPLLHAAQFVAVDVQVAQDMSQTLHSNETEPAYCPEGHVRAHASALTTLK